MQNYFSAVVLTLATIAALPIAEASPLPSNHVFPVDADYTYSGSAGNWLVNFTFTNNFTQPGNWSLYFAGIRLGATDIANIPTGYNTSITTVDAAALNAPDPRNGGAFAPVSANPIVYDNNWYNQNANTLFPHTSLSGFNAISHSTDAPIEIPWLVHVYLNEEPYGGDDYIYRIGNPGFQGVARGVSTNPPTDPNTVPEPGAILLVLVALGFVGLMERRRVLIAAVS